MRAGWALPILFTLSACAPKAEQQATYLDLDCARPFAEQAAAIVAQPQLTHAPEVAAEPYDYYSSTDLRTSYLITKPAAPAHPAILMQKAHEGVHDSGCAYGDKKAYAELLAYLDSLKSWRRKP